MFKTLDQEEMEKIIDKHFKLWKKDIFKITSNTFNGITEYMINEHYLFIKNDY